MNPKFLSTLSPNPARTQTRPKIPGPTYNSATAYCLLQKRVPFFTYFFYETRANTQQVLPVQTGLYRCGECMVQEINNENLNVR